MDTSPARSEARDRDRAAWANQPLSPNSRISCLGLSARGENILLTLGVWTVKEFLSLDPDELFLERNCGVKTHAELTRAQEEARRRLSEHPGCEHASLAEDADPAPFETVQPNSHISCLGLSQRGRKTLGKLGAWTVKEFLSLDPNEFRDVKNCGVKTYAELSRAQEEARRRLSERPGGEQMSLPEDADPALRGTARDPATMRSDKLPKRSGNKAPRVEVDWRTPDSFLRSLVWLATARERQRAILLGRMGWRSEPRKLAELARALGTSRQNISAICQAGLKKFARRRVREALQPLYDLLRGMLEDVSPVLDLRAVGRRLRRRFGWQRPLHHKALVALLGAFPEFKQFDGQYVCDQRFRCPECPVLLGVLHKVLTAKTVRELPLFELAEEVATQTWATEECRNCTVTPTRASANLLRVALNRSSALKDRYRLERRTIWHVGQFRLAMGPLSAAVEAVLREHPGAMSYRDVHAAVNPYRDKKVTPDAVWTALTRCLERGSDVLLWDLGGVYQHKCHVDLDAPLLGKIEKWILNTLRKGPFPQLSTNAAFRAFQKDCLAAGLASEHTLHSCLRHRGHPKLAFFRTPWLGLAGPAARRVPNHEIGEALIRQAGGVMEYEALRQALCDRMGLKPPQFRQAIAPLKNVIRMEN